MGYNDIVKDYVITSNNLVRKSAYNPEQDRLPTDDEIRLCEEFIEKYTVSTDKLNPKNHSYHMKHAVEQWYGRYISNGAFIGAAMNKGFRIKMTEGNPYFNMQKIPSQDSYKKYWEHKVSQNSPTKMMEQHKGILWDEYKIYCRETLREFPPVTQKEFFQYLSTVVHFDRHGQIDKIDSATPEQISYPEEVQDSSTFKSLSRE